MLRCSFTCFFSSRANTSIGDFCTRPFIPQLYVHLLIHLWPTNSITGHAIFVADSVEIFL